MVRSVDSETSYFCSANLKQTYVKTFSLSCMISFTNRRTEVEFTEDENNDEYNLLIVLSERKDAQSTCLCCPRYRPIS